MNILAASVTELNLRHLFVTFTLVAALRQPSSRIGFPSGAFGNKPNFPCFSRPTLIARSTKSGKAPKAVIHPDTEFRRRARAYVERCGYQMIVSSTSARSLPTAFKRGLRAGRKAGAFSLISFGIGAHS